MRIAGVIILLLLASGCKTSSITQTSDQRNAETFAAPTYIVLGLPHHVESELLAIRKSYDSYMAGLPAEITVAGSSGVGTLSEGQDPEQVFSAVREVGRQHLPFSTAFVSVERFPGTQIFWLKPRDRRPFDAMHSGLVAAGIKFRTSPFTYTPHCTISAISKLTALQEKELLSTSFPRDAFVVNRISLYQLVDGKASLLRSFEF